MEVGGTGLGAALTWYDDARYYLGGQAQLTYAALDLDGSTDPYRAKLAYDRPDSLTARIGLAANYQSSWQDAMGFTRQAGLYGIASLHRQFLGRARWIVSGERFTTAEENVWAGIGAGGTYNWNDGRYGMFAKLAAQSTIEQFAENHTISGNLAFKVKW